MSQHRVKVLYIAGAGRSGSTLLGRLLGESKEAVHVGEMVYLWRRCFRNRHVCGCGTPFYKCPFWNEVFRRGFGGFGGVDFERILETKRQIERTRFLPLLLSPWKRPVQQRRLEEYRQVLQTLYHAIAEISGASVVVDGSKSEAYGYLLETVPGLDVRGLHLVRDSRAVAYSHRRRKPDPALGIESGALAMMSPSEASFQWNATNLLLNWKMPGHDPLFLRYEDFIAGPEETLRRLWDFLEEPVPPLDFLQSVSLHLRTNHTAAGNPDRFQSEVQIKPDLEWQRKMTPADRRLVTALTLPLLLRYGYLHPLPSAAARTGIQPSRVL